MKSNAKRNERISLSKFPVTHLDVNFVQSQLNSYSWLLERGIQELFDEINPVEDYSKNSWELKFFDVKLGEPNIPLSLAMKKGLSYDAPLTVTASLKNRKTGEIKEQQIYLADLPIFTNRATFVVNGNERAVVQQIARSEGVLFSELKNSTPQRPLYGVKIIPTRGKWYTLEINKAGVMSVKLLDGRPRVYLTTILKALGYTTEEIIEYFKDINIGDIDFLKVTLSKDKTKSREDALIDIFQKLRPEDSATLQSAETFFESIFFGKRRFYLGRVGRYVLNKKIYGVDSKDIEEKDHMLNSQDILELVKTLVKLNNKIIQPDDIDHLSNRRVRGAGELIQDRIRIGILRMEKNIKDKMSQFSTEDLVTPLLIVNARPVSAAVQQFFGSSELSRFMDQQNPLSEIETKRKMTVGGPGGLSKDNAPITVRDVHYSHYAKIDPVATPESVGVGMTTHMAIYARVNEFGFLETPYRKVLDAEGMKSNKIKLKDGSEPQKGEMYVTDIVEYLSADYEHDKYIAHAGINIGHNKTIVDDTIFCRYGSQYVNVSKNKIQYIDVSPSQIGGMSMSIVPFVAHDDTSRALMAVNMQRQAVPLLKPQAPLVGTGFEKVIAKASGRAIYAEANGMVTYADSKVITVKYDEKVRTLSTESIKMEDGKRKKKDILKEEWIDTDTISYELSKFVRTNQNTSYTQHSVVEIGQKVKKGQVLAEGPAMDFDEIALGTNLRVAYIPWNGYNFQDGIVISERLVKEDILTSVHIKEYVQEIRETKLGDEEITRDIPNVSDFMLRNLDEEGIVRIGSAVKAGDVLVGVVSPKGEVEMSAEEKLLRVIFGESARDVRDSSLALPHGDKGIVIDVQVLDRNRGDKLNPGVLKQVKVYVARTHKIGVGDKLTGRHGDKGVITKVLPIEDMPYTEDGKPVDIILNPLGVIKRMNLGQLKETHLGKIAEQLSQSYAIPPFAPIDESQIMEFAKKEGCDIAQKVKLYDGRTGELFDKEVVVGIRYMLKLDHLAEDKAHARSVGPYTIVTQQPIGGKAQFGGQRFGEMEVWALEAHGVPNLLQEALTTRSDDVANRTFAYRAILQGSDIPPAKIPESYGVIKSELRALGLNLEEMEAEKNSRNNDLMIATGEFPDISETIAPEMPVSQENKDSEIEIEKLD